MRIYIVQKDDTLYKIAKRHQVELDDIIKLNPHIANPEYIVPGMKIKLPNRDEYEGDFEKKSRQKVDTHRAPTTGARVNDRPLGSVSGMEDRGAQEERIPLQRKGYFSQGQYKKTTTSAQPAPYSEGNVTNKRGNQPVKTYSNKQYVRSAEANHYDQQQPHYPVDQVENHSQFNAHRQNRDMYAPYPELHQQHFCPCCAYHWHMHQTMTNPYYEATPPRENKRIYY